MGINSPKGNSRNVAAEGGIVSVYYGGTLIGALIAGSLADRAGRIKAVVFGSMWALLGAVLQASAQNIAWMCCVRIFGAYVSSLDIVESSLSFPLSLSLFQGSPSPPKQTKTDFEIASQARVLAGIGVGAIDCVIPVWSAEVSSHSARGAFLAIEFFMVRQLPPTSSTWLIIVRILAVLL